MSDTRRFHRLSHITKLPDGHIFVFGSNESGVHGAGAAKLAMQKFGAIYGVGFGPQGNSFAIPTKDWEIQSLPLPVIKTYVKRFLAWAKLRNSTTFYVTQIGCGLAGFSVGEIAPFFSEVPNNVILPIEFK